jgi:myo-inositol-1(or 4)-monophosphatase
VSIAAVVDGAPVVGIVVDIVRDLTYSTWAGGGAWCGERRLAVSTIAEPALALIGTGFPFKAPANARIDEYLAQFQRVLHGSSGIRRAGSAALDFAHVAEGRLDGFWEIGLAAWDIAAGVLLVREAGGLVTDLAGRPASIAPGDFVAGSQAMHAWLLGQFSRGRQREGQGRPAV